MSTSDTRTRELAALDDALAGRPVDPDLAGLAELAVAVRDERPAPDPAFTRSLDERVERGFPRAPRRRGIKWPRVSAPVLGLAASVFLIVVVAVSIPKGGDDSASSGGGATAQRAPSGGDTAAAGSGGSAAKPRGGDSAAVDAADQPFPRLTRRDFSANHRRSVERSAELVLATRPRDIDRAAAEILRVTDELGGYVVSSTVSSGSSGQFELRVPERRLQAALSRLSRVAKVRGRTQNALDITGAVVSARERLKDARTERRALLRQLAAATTPNQTASIRARLRLVSAQIAAGKRGLARVRTRAIRSTITVSLVADRKAGGAPGGGWTPGDALDDAVRILEVTAGVLLVALAVLVPLGLLALPAWLATRQAAQRRRERALDAV